MYVLGETNLDRYKLHYRADGQLLDDVADGEPDPPASAGFMEFGIRPMRGTDRALFSEKSDDADGDEQQTAALITLVVWIKGLAVRERDEDGQPKGEPVPISRFSEENVRLVDDAILVRVVRRITRRMEDTYRGLGESEKPSAS
jgi:hypothetical protein